MLLTQHIKIYWGKECRGAPYSTNRNQVAKAFDLPKGFFDYAPIGYPSHYLFFIQNKNGIVERINRIDSVTEFENIRFDALEIIKISNFYEVKYRYDFHKAIPRRIKFDYKDGGLVDLKELAMRLLPNEYGRIVYNGRYTDYDTGNWFYNLDVINIINTLKKKVSLNIFSANKPDKLYKQIEMLY